jgi:hypothetical protein
MKLCRFLFFVDIFFMRGLNLLSWTWSKMQTMEKESVVLLPLSSKKTRTENDGKEEENFIQIDSASNLIECTICFIPFNAKMLIV